jgi:hypothetical protein
MYSNIAKWFSGNNNVMCDVCGRKRKRSECTLAYGTGMIPVVMSCIDGCADYNHPLNYPPPIIFDGRPVQDARPQPTDQFIAYTMPSFMQWGHLLNAPKWGQFNEPDNEFDLNVNWTWGAFSKE